MRMIQRLVNADFASELPITPSRLPNLFEDLWLFQPFLFDDLSGVLLPGPHARQFVDHGETALIISTSDGNKKTLPI